MARTTNGTSDFIAMDGANVASMAAAFSVAVWLNSASALNVSYYTESRSSSNNPFFQLNLNSGKVRVFFRRDSNAGTSDVNGTPVSTTTAADGTWHHVVFTQTAGSWAIYIDGLADATAFGTYTTQTMTVDRVTLGALRRSTNSNFTAGSFAELATWTRQLSANEIASLANGVPAWMFGAAHYWPLNGVDSPEPDFGMG